MAQQYQSEQAAFFQNLDKHVFAQPLVADTVGAGQIELNEMRRANLLTDGWQKNGRVTYSGRGLLLAGVMMALAVHMRPREAAAYALAFSDWFDQCADGSDTDWWKRICHFPSFVLSRDGNNEPRLIRPGDPDDDLFGRRIYFEYEKDFRKRPLPNHIVVALPVGKLVKQWAIGAILRLQSGSNEIES